MSLPSSLPRVAAARAVNGADAGLFLRIPRRDGWQHSPVFRRSFRLLRDKARRGLWKYTLLVQ